MSYEPTITIAGDNVNTVMPTAVKYVLDNSTVQETRNGPAHNAHSALISHYRKPRQRVLFLEARDANPVFHFFESLWMLAGRNDVAFPGYYAANISNFSDDGATLHGAYGHRWVNHFGFDQLEMVIQHLRNSPGSRRCLLDMWEPGDLRLSTEGSTKDVPCNFSIKFELVRKRHSEDPKEFQLNMWVLNRSNDLLWGAYGANVFHMSFLQEYIADRLGASVGFYEQVSLDAHVYTDALYGKMFSRVVHHLQDQNWYGEDPYGVDFTLFTVSPVLTKGSFHNGRLEVPGWSGADGISPEDLEATFQTSLKTFIEAAPGTGHEALDNSATDVHPYFRDIVSPISRAHTLYKLKRYDDAIQVLGDANKALALFYQGDLPAGSQFEVYELDLFRATIQWIRRRQAAARV